MTVKKSQTGQAATTKPPKKKARAEAPIGGALTIERVPFERVNPAPYNPRVALTEADAEWQAIERSLGAFGYVEPMVWNRRTGTLVAGHQRLRILKSRGVTEADFSIVDLPEAEEKALNLALNRIKGRWDDAALASLLTELKSAEIGLEATGFTEADIDDLERILAGETDDDPAAADDTGQPSTTIRVMVGHVQWTEPRAKYDRWAEEIRRACGDDRDAMVKELRSRLGLGKRRGAQAV